LQGHELPNTGDGNASCASCFIGLQKITKKSPFVLGHGPADVHDYHDVLRTARSSHVPSRSKVGVDGWTGFTK